MCAVEKVNLLHGKQQKLKRCLKGLWLCRKKIFLVIGKTMMNLKTFAQMNLVFDCLGDCIDLGEIMEINKFTQAHMLNKEILFVPGLLKQSTHLKKLISLLELMLNAWRLLQKG